MIMYYVLSALRAGNWRALIAAWLHFEVSFTIWLLVGALGIPIAEEFSLSATEKGFLVAIPLLGGAALRIPFGLATDRFGPKPIGLLLLCIEMVALLCGWLTAADYVQMLAIGLLLGTAGASFAVALPLASRVYPPAHQGLAMGVAASANSGTVLAAFLAPRLAELVGWRGVFGVMLFPLLVTIVFVLVLVPSEKASGQGWTRQPAANVLWGTTIYRLCFLYSITFGGFVGFCSLLPIFLHDQYGTGVIGAGSVTAICGLGGSLARPIGGYLADRLSSSHLLAMVLFAIAGSVAAMSMLPEFRVMVMIVVLAVAVMGFGNGVVFRMVSDRFQSRIGSAAGIIGAAGGLGGFLLPAWLGFLKDVSGTYRAGFLLFAAFSVAAWLTTLKAGRRGSRTDEAVPGSDRFSH